MTTETLEHGVVAQKLEADTSSKSRSKGSKDSTLSEHSDTSEANCSAARLGLQKGRGGSQLWKKAKLVSGAVVHVTKPDQESQKEAYLMAQGLRSQGIEEIEDEESAICIRTGPLGRLERWVKGPNFDSLAGIAVLINTIVMVLDLEYHSIETARLVQHPEFGDEGTGEENWPMASAVFEILELFFAALFICELLLRVWFIGMPYLKAPMNWMDIGIVAMSVLDFFEFNAVGNITFLRLVRLVKLVRVLRMIRTLRLFRHLRLLMLSIRASMGALFWSLVLLLFLILIASIFMVQTLTPWLQNEDHDLSVRQFVYEYYGSFSRSMITMIQVTLTPGVFGVVARKVIYHVHTAYGLFFLAYLSVVSFAVIRVITALFIKETLDAANKDVQHVHSEIIRQKEQYSKKVRGIFEHFDKSGDGSLSLEELELAFQDPELRAWFKVLDIDPKETEGWIRLKYYSEDDEDDQKETTITCEDFVETVMQVKGGASKVDLPTMLLEFNKVTDYVKKVKNNIKKHNQENMLDAVKSCVQQVDALVKKDMHDELLKAIHDIRSDFGQAISKVRQDVKAELAETKKLAENVKLIVDMTHDAQTETQNPKAIMQSDLHEELMKAIKDIRSDFGQAISQVRQDVKAELAENVKLIVDMKNDAQTETPNTKAIVQSDLHEELMKAIKDFQSDFASATQSVRQDISQVRQDVKVELAENVKSIAEKEIDARTEAAQNTKATMGSNLHEEAAKIIQDFQSDFASATRELRQAISQVTQDDDRAKVRFPDASQVVHKPNIGLIEEAQQPLELSRCANAPELVGTAHGSEMESTQFRIPKQGLTSKGPEPLKDSECKARLSSKDSTSSKHDSPLHTECDHPALELWQDLVQVLWKWAPKSAGGGGCTKDDASQSSSSPFLKEIIHTHSNQRYQSDAATCAVDASDITLC